ncbi:SipW-dependent-type signal peptide-containing protein [Thermococcus radiotolerans]|uniref:SipW-cognate class signal peptide n=1 Tax=Thermococcus radiotolerans TaxID=187880 RepID=A0A2Z2NC52_9EURY|nr:SipW-dependent-type signal peptide-containing protein [Thermococcus radiotolerans]ASJ15266.1 hypothetical protein A3L10_09045 [Thermococcus radiotolerans]
MRSIAVTFLLIGLLVAGMGYGTWAVYHDEETSTGNYVQAGTLDLVLTDNTSSADGQWNIWGGYPGQPGLTQGDGEIRIYNVGTIPAGNVRIWFTFECHEDDNGNPNDGYNPGPESDTNLTGVGSWLKEIKVTEMRYSENNGRPNINIVYDNGNSWDSTYIQDLDGDDRITLYDLSLQEITGLYAPYPNGNPDSNSGYTAFEMSFRIIDTGSEQNYWQGDVCIMTVHVKLEQET